MFNSDLSPPILSFMQSQSEKGATFAAEMILHLASLAHGEGNACGLTSTQWTTLRYFALATSSSRTLLAFADYHVTTRGTASQTVKNLVAKGLLVRSPSQLDARSSQIDLTADGRDLYEKDPFHNLACAVEDLSPKRLADFFITLEHLVGRVIDGRQRRHFGICSMCRYLGTCLNQKGDEQSHICQQNGVPLLSEEFDQLCIQYEPEIK